MFHYLVRVPSEDSTLISEDAVVSRLDSYNGSSKYLLYESGDSAETRFLMVSDEKLSEDDTTKLRSVFERTVVVEDLTVDAISDGMLCKLRTTIDLMADTGSFHGKKKTLLVTDDCAQVLEKADELTGNSTFRAFLEGFSDYIDRSKDMTAKAMYNVVLVNQGKASPDSFLESLARFLAAKGLLTEQVMITGDIRDATNTERETRLVYVIDDTWKTKDDASDEDLLLSLIFGGSSESSTSDMHRLFRKIRESCNIYITAMEQADFDRISTLDSFAITFPHVHVLGDPSVEDRRKLVSAIAGEYAFTVDLDSFSETVSPYTTMEDIEIAMRTSIYRKLRAKDASTHIGPGDFVLMGENRPKTSAYDELDALIGLDGVKTTVREIVTFLEKRGKAAVPCLHMAFLGNPGTGKTTVARIIAKIFAEAGLVEKDLFVETQRGGMIGEYTGQTAPKTAKVIYSAMGGVLFIDEAYALVQRDDDGYGHEAVSTLVKVMEDRRDKFVCILAGYPKEMNAMLDANPGLRDRIQF